MHGFRGKYAWAITALFFFTAINYVTPLVASATIDFALSGEPDDGHLTSGVIAAMGGAYLIANGSLTVGTLFAFLIFLNMLLWPVRQMGRTLTELGKSTVALTRMGEILEEPEESAPRVPATRVSPVEGKIEVSDLVFGYGEDEKELMGISFSVKASETLAIVWPSGSGKSTIMSLLLRLYDYQSGSIRFDGYELTELDRQWVRSQFSVVMQEPFLYSKTVGENIRLSREGAVGDDVTEAARLADIHDTISSFGEGYATQIGERGDSIRWTTSTGGAGAGVSSRHSGVVAG